MSLFPHFAGAQVATFTWTDSTTNWNTNGAWTSTSGLFPNDLFNHIAYFGPRATITNQPQVTSNVSVLGFIVDNSGGGVYSLGTTSGSLTIGTGGIKITGTGTTVITTPIIVGANQTWDIGTGSYLKLNQAASGQFQSAFTITKEGAGTLEVGGNTVILPTYGGYAVNTGTMLAANTNAGSAAFGRSQITLGANGALIDTATTGSMRIGELSGSGRVDSTIGLSTAAISQIEVMANATSSATIISGTATTMSIRGLATQTFTGTTTGIAGAVAVYGTPSGNTSTNGLTLAGSASLANTTNSLTIRGGQLTLDNSTTNSTTRLGTNTVSISGGVLSLIGNSAGTAQSAGVLTMNNAGQSNIVVTVPSGATAGSQLTFGNSATFSLRGSTSMSVNFVGVGGTLGTAGTNPRIAFVGTPFTNANGLLANSSGGATTGWAIVNGADWAGYGANGVVAVAGTARDSSTLFSAASTEATAFTPSTTTTSGAAIASNALKISPTATGQSISMTGNLSTQGILLPGTRDFTITGGSLVGASTRNIWVTDPNTTLSMTTNMAGANQPLNKQGDGFLDLNGASNQMGFTTAQNVNINNGVLRYSNTTSGGFGASGGAFSKINLDGGVLELSGGGSFFRALNLAGTAGGGGIGWDSNANGGFSAIGGDATVTITAAIGSTTATTPIWGTTTGFLTEGQALLFGSLKADSKITMANGFDIDTPTSSTFREIRVIDNPNSPNDLARISGAIIAGAGTGNSVDLLKTGSGTLELSGANNYAGGTIIAEGTVLASNTNAFGGLSNSNKAPVVLGNRGGSANVALYTTTGLTIAQNIYVLAGSTGTSTLGNLADNATTFSGDITLAKGLTVTSQSTGANSLALTGTISGTGRLTKTGPGRLSLSSGNTFTGGVSINSGTVQIGAASALGQAPTTFVANNVTIDGGAIASGSGSPFLGNTRGITLTANGAIFDAAATRTITSSGKITGPGRISKYGPGTLVLSNTTSDYTGGVAVNGGVLSIGSALSLGANPATPTAAFLSLNGGTLNWTGGVNNSAPNRGVTLGVGNGTFDIDSGGSLRVDGVITGPGGLGKTGLGDLALPAANDYTGPTTITAGRLLLNGAYSGGGKITVQTGGTLGGSGSTNGQVEVESGGHLAPGSSIATITVGALTLDASSNYDVEFDAPTSGPVINDNTIVSAGGSITIDPTAVLNVSLVSGGSNGYFTSGPGSFPNRFTYTIVDNQTANAVTGAFAGLAEGAEISVPSLGRTFEISYIGGDGNDITLTTVPEPTTVSTLLVGAAAMAMRRRRRQVA